MYKTQAQPSAGAESSHHSSLHAQVLEDEQINLSRAAERLLSLQEEAKALAEKGSNAKEPAPEGELSL